MPTADDVENCKDQEGDVTDMAQAHRDLARGEQAAASIEFSLARFELRVQALLDAVQTAMPPPPYSSSTSLATAAPPYAASASLAAARPGADTDADTDAKSKDGDGSRGEKQPQQGDGGKQL